MTLDNREIESMKFKEPMVIFPLKQYEELMEYVENMEDRLSAKERADEPEISKADFDKMFREKFGKE